MSKVSIDLLFPSNSGKRKYGNIDIETLFPINNNNARFKVNMPVFDPDKLTEERENRKNELKQIYRNMLSLCLKKITNVNKMDCTDMVYEVPTKVFLYPKYNSLECLQYIEKKLRKSYLDTLIISDKSIFVSWLNVSRNKEISRD